MYKTLLFRSLQSSALIRNRALKKRDKNTIRNWNSIKNRCQGCGRTLTYLKIIWRYWRSKTKNFRPSCPTRNQLILLLKLWSSLTDWKKTIRDWLMRLRSCKMTISSFNPSLGSAEKPYNSKTGLLLTYKRSWIVWPTIIWEVLLRS